MKNRNNLDVILLAIKSSIGIVYKQFTPFNKNWISKLILKFAEDIHTCTCMTISLDAFNIASF